PRWCTPLSRSSFLLSARPRRPPPSFPTRRSSDLPRLRGGPHVVAGGEQDAHVHALRRGPPHDEIPADVELRFEQGQPPGERPHRSEEHTSELQSPCNLVCRLLLEKKKNHTIL